MGLPRANKLIRSTLKCGPCISTVKNYVRQIKVQYKANLLPGDVDGRMRRAARLWAPILIAKIEDGVLAEGERVPVTSGADATPTPAHPQYCGDRNIIAGLCGPIVLSVLTINVQRQNQYRLLTVRSVSIKLLS